MPTLPPPGMPPVDPNTLMGGPPGGPPPPGLDSGGGPPGAEGGPGSDMFSMGMSALDRLKSTQPSGEVMMGQVKQGLDLIGQIIAKILPLVGQWDPKISKDLHTIGRQIADARMNLSKEPEPGMPPANLMGGMQSMGLPGGLPKV